MIDTERKEDLFLDTKLIKSENRLGKLRIIDELHPVLGGQPTHEKDQPNDNNPFLDLACTMQFTIDKVNAVDKKADTKLAKAQNLKDVANIAIARDNLGLGTSATMNATSTLSDRTDQTATIKAVNDVNRDVVTAQKTANNAHALAQSKQDKLQFIGAGPEVMKTGAFGVGSRTRDFSYNPDPLGELPGADGKASLANGFYIVPSTAPGTRPNGARTGGYQFIHVNYSDEYYSQIALANTDTGDGVYRNTAYPRGQTGWVKMYDKKNTTVDSNGFIREHGNKNAVTEDKITDDLNLNRSDYVASAKSAHDINNKAVKAQQTADRKRDVDDVTFTKPNFSALILRNSDVQGIGAYMHIINTNGRCLQLAYRDDRNSKDGQTIINLPTQGGNIPVIDQTSAISATQYTAWKKASTLPGATKLTSIYESSSVTQVLKLIPSNSLFESLEARGSGEDIEHRARYRRIIRTGN